MTASSSTDSTVDPAPWGRSADRRPRSALPLGDRLLVDPVALGERPQALLTMLYRSTDRLCRRGAPMKNLAHSASFDSDDKIAPSKPGTQTSKRLPKGMKPIRPGELVQIDTLFVNVAPDKAVKHFTAHDPVAKWTVALVAGRATARCAAALLDKLIAEVPFRIEGIQVDGGSEFRAEFEDACRERNLCLFVLPPKRPQLNF